MTFRREDGECERDAEGMQTMRTLGRNMAGVAYLPLYMAPLLVAHR